MEDEVATFTRNLFERYGCDFRGYRSSSLEKRLRNLCANLQLPGIDALTAWVLDNPTRIDFIVENITVPVSDYFREPETFAEVKEHVFPHLRSFSNITIWHAGCAAGQEVYSLAILLNEAGLYSRSRIFASDISASCLSAARDGAEIDEKQLAAIERRYAQGGGSGSLSSYTIRSGDRYRFDPQLLKNVTFIQHNLATDGVFCEANLIFCRNVLIYFGPELQRRVFDLFQDSMFRGGFLCLGSRETPISTGAAYCKEPGCNLIYRPLQPARSQISMGDGLIEKGGDQ